MGTLAGGSVAQSQRSPSLRVAFLTDTHLPTSGQNANMRKILDQIQNQHKADLILFGGDNVMAVESVGQSEARAQLANWGDLIAQNVHVPYASCLGNHDLWGWSVQPAKDLYQGKRMAMDAFSMPSRYYSFERAGWRFMVLDSIQPGPLGYTTFVDDEQLAWIQRELQRSNLPTVVVSHAPVLSVTGLMMGSERGAQYGQRVPSHKYVANNRSLIELFADRPNVHVCLSGHMHMVDEVKYRGMRHICGGAVCGGWWKGAFLEFEPAYVLLDLFRDGNTRHQVVRWNQST